ncbi:hypothetical protein WICPIJ_007753 [Wickerhamomyces pijperi]|uniref:Uncharacterized protein n=1 Tax=Wickerhamomyces pijperi TaxID=599730 RepID=A0A9P8PZY2_WICPI|nr:hypothetical protein WICPIJ_007753 [Wickerhamomyces pijperi]
MEMTSLAPLSNKVSAALTKVPQVSAISSIRIQILSVTSPTRTILDTSLAFWRSLWIKAKFKSNLSAVEATLLAPPASGETKMAFFKSMLCFKYSKTDGSAYKLSTGMVKNPWI